MLVRRLDELMARGLHQMGVILLTFLTGVDRQITKRHTFVEIRDTATLFRQRLCGEQSGGAVVLFCA